MSFLFGGGGSESNLIIPEGEKPKAFQTVIPQKSYKDLAESMGRTETEYNRLLDTRYDMTGTGAQIGAKQRGIEMQEAASYASSLPAASSPDTSFRGTPREFEVTSNTQGTFDTAAGQKSGSSKAKPAVENKPGKKPAQAKKVKPTADKEQKVEAVTTDTVPDKKDQEQVIKESTASEKDTDMTTSEEQGKE